ncbi:MAG: hypothetical protein LBG21_06670 [Campylobacteraceae bacterium]|jgi:hypothetical protein|nr:hypothetical protein [Campylobacteraceae bacterium]
MNNTTRGVVYTYTYRIKLLNEGDYVSYLELDWNSADYNWEAKADVEFGYYTAVRGVLLAELKDVSNESSLRADKIRIEDYDYDSDTEGWQLIITSDVKIPKITSVRAYASEQYTERSFVELKAKYQENIDDALIYKLPSIQPVEVCLLIWDRKV